MNFHKAPATYVSDVTIRVSDLQRSIEFYEEVVGLRVKERASNWAHLTAMHDDQVLLKLLQPEDVRLKLEQTTGLYHFAILLHNRKSLAQVVNNLLRHHIRFGGGDHIVSEAIYFSDPDGHGIEIYADRDANGWNWQENEVEMATLPVDFEDLLKENEAEIWQGLPEGTLMGHIHLQVNNIDVNQTFYVDGLGFDIVSRIANTALFISDSGYHHHIAFNTWAGESIRHAAANEVGLESFTIVFPSEEKLEQIVKELKALKFEVKEADGQLYTIDPSQTKIFLEKA